jgi:hypothetical protein
MQLGQPQARTTRRAALIIATVVALLLPVAAIAGNSSGFDDAPDDNIFASDIGWMKDNGISKGCNPPANTFFCPSDDVTREQMSAFMHRLGTSRVVDAGTVEGLTAAELKGQTGDTGAAGPAGADGAKGDQGDTGAKGDTGDTGAKGDQGDTGDTGAKGDTGDTGPAGADGGDGVVLGFYERTWSTSYSEGLLFGGSVSAPDASQPTCDAGDYGTGSWHWISGNGFVTNNKISTNGANAVMAFSATVFGDGTIEATLICADVTPAP